jgi:hypothetical protein
MSQSLEKMYILWILLWWASICNAVFTPALFPVCLNKNAWRMPDWHLSSNDFIEIFNDKNRPWRHSSIKGLIESKSLPEYIVLPQPLLPTENLVVLELYSEAMKLVAEDDATPAHEKILLKTDLSKTRPAGISRRSAKVPVGCFLGRGGLAQPQNRRKACSTGTAH